MLTASSSFRHTPAEGAWATIKCGYKPRAAEDEKPGRTLIPGVRLLVTPKPKVCQQASVTFPPEVDGKYGQHYAYRSPEWQRLYTSGRQTIESLNRSNKRGYFAPIKDPDWRPRRGWLPTLLAGLTLIIATNVRKIIAWAWDEIDTAHGFRTPSEPRKRRRELTAGYTAPQSASAPPRRGRRLGHPSAPHAEHDLHRASRRLPSMQPSPGASACRSEAAHRVAGSAVLGPRAAWLQGERRAPRLRSAPARTLPSRSAVQASRTNRNRRSHPNDPRVPGEGT